MADKLKFYDMKEKKSFETDEYEVVIRGKSRMAKTKAPSGIESWRILGRVD